MIELKLQDDSLTVGEEFAIARALRRKRVALWREKNARYRARNLEAGLCPLCSRRPNPGNKFCAVCITRCNRGRKAQP